MKKDTKKVITREGMKKKQTKQAVALCFGLGSVGIVIALLSSLFIPALFREISKGFLMEDPIYTSAFLLLAAFIFFIIAVCLLPIILGIHSLCRVCSGYLIAESEIEYIKPYEEEHVDRRRYGNRVYYYHGIYFKEHGKFLTEGNPEDYHAGDKYYLEIIGKKKPKIVAIYEQSKFILK